MFDQLQLRATLPASDFDRAKAWYRDKLGLEPSEEREDGAIYTTGDSEFLLYPSTFAGTNQATAAGWTVEDFDAAMAHLRDSGVVFEEYDFPGFKTVDGVADLDGQKGAWFKDSEGNILAISDM